MADILFLRDLGLLIGFAWFLWERGRALLMFFQQEEYDDPRYVRWWWQNRAVDRRLSLAALFALGAGALAGQGLAALLLLGGILWGGWRSRALLAAAKKPLVMTKRARRLHLLAFALALTVTGLLFALTGLAPLTALIVAQAAPFLLILANILLRPLEKRVKAGFRREAEAKLRELAPYTIAITGSFGKTSTKHLMAHILSSVDTVLATPGSVNTPMGITRVVRETLTAEHRYFIAEMGAYGPGSIANLCRLAPPDLSMVTAVGPAHYERFKTLEAVFDTKFEIADAAAAKGGKTIVAADGVLPHKLKERLAWDKDLILVGGDPDHWLYCQQVDLTADGLTLTVAERGETPVTLRVPLYGRQHRDNILCAVAAARQLGIPMAVIKAALATQPQVRHRLEVISSPGGPTVLDDAYNSNPRGFETALEVLGVLVKPGGKRILVTPGMVELGAKHADEHARLGALAARSVDVALIVTPERIPSFVEAFRAAGTAAELRLEASQADAQAWVTAHAGPADAVLYENNLPDLYEARPRF